MLASSKTSRNSTGKSTVLAMGQSLTGSESSSSQRKWGIAALPVTGAGSIDWASKNQVGQFEGSKGHWASIGPDSYDTSEPLNRPSPSVQPSRLDLF